MQPKFFMVKGVWAFAAPANRSRAMRSPPRQAWEGVGGRKRVIESVKGGGKRDKASHNSFTDEAIPVANDLLEKERKSKSN